MIELILLMPTWRTEKWVSFDPRLLIHIMPYISLATTIPPGLTQLHSGPGCVSFDNFVDLTLKEWGELKSEDLLREAFRVFDISNTGTLSYEQMVHILTNIGDEAITISDGEFRVKCLVDIQGELEDKVLIFGYMKSKTSNRYR